MSKPDYETNIWFLKQMCDVGANTIGNELLEILNRAERLESLLDAIKDSEKTTIHSDFVECMDRAYKIIKDLEDE